MAFTFIDGEENSEDKIKIVEMYIEQRLSSSIVEIVKQQNFKL